MIGFIAAGILCDRPVALSGDKLSQTMVRYGTIHSTMFAPLGW